MEACLQNQVIGVHGNISFNGVDLNSHNNLFSSVHVIVGSVVPHCDAHKSPLNNTKTEPFLNVTKLIVCEITILAIFKLFSHI